MNAVVIYLILNRLPITFLQVNEILARSSVWSAFKDQKHDLFISDSQTAGYLTGTVFMCIQSVYSQADLLVVSVCVKGKSSAPLSESNLNALLYPKKNLTADSSLVLKPSNPYSVHVL